MKTNPHQIRNTRPRKRGVALVISLGFIVLLTMLVTSYLVSMRLDRLSTHNYSQMVRSQELARGAVVEILGDMQQEIIAGSLQDQDYTVNGVPAYIPLTSESSQPARLGFSSSDYGTDVDTTGKLLPPTLLRVSRSGSNLYDGLIEYPVTKKLHYDAAELPANRTSPVATTTRALNGRYISAERWNAPKLMGTVVPEAFEQAPPEWVYVTREGSAVLKDADADKIKATGNLDEEQQVMGRYAFVVYATGSLLDVNVAGYPSSLTEEPGGKQALRFKPAQSYVDLTVLPGMSGKTDEIDALINWRNKGSLASNSFQTMVENSQEKGFLEFETGDSPLLSRQDLIAYFEREKLPEEALPYLTTMSLSNNAPSWSPRLNSPDIPGYQTGMGTDFLYWDNSEEEASPNRNLANVRFGEDGTVIHYDDDGVAHTYAVKEGDPLLQARFSLAKLAWLAEGNAVSGLGPSGDKAKAIQACFGLQWAPPGMGAGANRTANGGNPCWNYTGSTGNSAVGKIKTLAEVAEEGREPNFFELLKAAILEGSIGQSTGPGAFVNGTVPKSAPYDYRYRYPTEEQAPGAAGFYTHTLGPYNDTPAPARIPDMHIIRIGANIIDQYDADSYPTAIYFPYEGLGNWDPAISDISNPILGPVSMAFGMENIPYLSRIIALNCTPERSGSGDLVGDDSGDQATNVYAGWRIPELYCPHQMPDTEPADRPTQFEIRAYGSAQTFWGWHTGHSLYDYRSGLSPVRDFYQENSNAEEVPEATINFEISGLPQSLYTRPRTLTYDSIPGVINVTSHEDNMANEDMPFFTKVDDAHYKTNTTNHFVGFCTGITDTVDHGVGSDYRPFWVPETSTDTYDPVAAGKPRTVNGSCGTEGTPVNTYVLGWKNGEKFHPYSFIEGVYTYNYSTMYMNRGATLTQMASHDTRIGSSITDAMSPDKWVLPDPRTGRFSVSYAYFGGGPKANNTVWYNYNSSVPGFSSHGRAPAFTYEPHPYNNVEHVNRPGEFILNTATDPNRPNYYADRDGVVRPGDGIYGSTSTGDGIPTLSRTPRPVDAPAADGDKTVEQHARRPVILNRPFESLGELGYVFRDLPFKTLDFFSESSGDAGLLDVFSLQDEAVVGTNGLTSLSAGQVNPNFAPVPVLEALLKGAAKKERDEAYNMETDTKALAQKIAEEIHSGNGQPLSNTTELVTVLGKAARTAMVADQDRRNKAYIEAPLRAMAGKSDLRTWNLMIDVIAQSGQISSSATELDDFVVKAECRYWLHVAIDRYTGEVVGQRIEAVYE